MDILTLISTTLVCRTRLFLCTDSQAQESCMRCSNQQQSALTHLQTLRLELQTVVPQCVQCGVPRYKPNFGLCASFLADDSWASSKM